MKMIFGRVARKVPAEAAGKSGLLYAVLRRSRKVALVASPARKFRRVNFITESYMETGFAVSIPGKTKSPRDFSRGLSLFFEISNFKSEISEIIPAASYSPTQLPA
jgi:hypothetical protein